MRVDRIIKNARIFTADHKKPEATALVVKDKRFIYVGDESGLFDFEGEITDLKGKFIMPGIIDSHVHVTFGVGLEYLDPGINIECDSKAEALYGMADIIKNDPDRNSFRFVLDRESLHGDDITKEELDKICPEGEVLVIEDESHSAWANSRLLIRHHITDDTPDPASGLSYFVRKDGHITGAVFEALIMRFIMDGAENITDEEIDTALKRWIDYSVDHGVTNVFDAGIPDGNDFHERVYARLCEMDRRGKLPVFVDGCYVVWEPGKTKEGIEELKRFNRQYNTEHVKVHTLKIFMDGTLKIETAALVKPYKDTGKLGTTYFNKDELSEAIRELNKAGFDLHLHTVGEGAARTVLDSVETVSHELGDTFRVKVTCAHLEIVDDKDMNRFAHLGVFADFTPWWHYGNTVGVPYEIWSKILGDKRAGKMYRCKTIWDSGAIVTWSSDEVFFGDFLAWNPYLGMEIGMTRRITEKTMTDKWRLTETAFPSDSEKMSIEEMMLGYTINGARQLGIEARKGSIEADKDADFLVFDKDLRAIDPEGLSHIKPREVYICGRKYPR